MESGTQLGPYEIREQLGKGGMGAVYLAEDTRLGRRVAIKVLPSEFASDPERLARFEREARAAAALNHPHIAVVHDVGQSDDTRYIVQEYLQGQTLRTVLEQSPLPVRRALTLGIEIAEALKAAHKAGITHRDLKPENIFVTDDGHAKVLDFGLAKLTETVAPGGADTALSPTVLGTVAGQILGTVGYLAPEQVEGRREVDGRADMFAFGCVLYEVVVGRRAFEGQSALDTLHAIARRTPESVGTYKPEAPSELGRILGKCLAKDRNDRYQQAADLLVDLRALAADLDAGRAASFAEAAAPSAGRSARRAAPLVAGGFLAGAVVTALAVVVVQRAGAPAGTGVARFKVVLSDTTLESTFGSAVVLSPDERAVAYATSEGLWVRRLDSLEPELLVESTLTGPVFSPDGQWIAYQQGRSLWRVPITGGTPLAITDAIDPRGADWFEAESILFVPFSRSPIVRTATDGTGEPEAVTELQGDEATHRWPQMLPGGRALLYTAHSRAAGFEDANIMVRDLETGEQRVLYRGGSYARYVPTGHLVFVSGTQLFAVPFDLDRLTVTGAATPVLDDVFTSTSTGTAHFDVTTNGTILYVTSLTGADTLTRWAFVSPDGTVEQTWVPDGFSWGPALSPDGRRFVVTVVSDDDGRTDLWSWDRTRAVPARLTSSQTGERYALWTPDGRSLIYAFDSGQGITGNQRLYRMGADGSGAAPLFPDEDVAAGKRELPLSLSADGRWLLTGLADEVHPSALRVRDLTGAESPRVLVETEELIHAADFSPDAKWIAYSSNESGRWEVYVVPFLAARGEKVAVTSGGGGMPHWSGDGRRLYYRSSAGVMAVDMEVVDGRLQAGEPRSVLEGRFVGGAVGYEFGAGGLANFEVARDGSSFMLQQPYGGSSQTTAVVVFNWTEELKRLVPVR